MPESQTRPVKCITVMLDGATTIVGRPTAPGQPDVQALIDDLLATGRKNGVQLAEPETTRPLPQYLTLSDLDAAVRRAEA
ncbi:hypothetical protein [Streptomyces sp. H39-S7]|uniref:hypothetical protein n=1 Tax=Streptomyces sp. H39-S7 TaxID=3004357 RepID=UPI0022AF1B18|nr:hypothetical protein [Streptomyces sp. H39-S7]MCZ4125015.1 hypothetical protein [Streptomyces sp. H39-S7]